LLERYTLLLLGVCMKYMKDEQEARDCVQQIFLKVLTDVSRYKIEFFKSWLYMVAKNHCLMRLRDKGAKNVRELKDQFHAEPDTDRQQLFEDDRTYQMLEEALKELQEEQRQCVILFFLKKHSYSQIQEMTGFTPMQVKSYIQNGKRNLRIILDRMLKESSNRRK
jgi:RNA polymerase sigma factor (sigma-70 family)